MKIKIPSSTSPILKQSNSSSILGDIIESFNVDLTSNLGKVKTTKTLMVKNGIKDDTDSFGVTFGANGDTTGGISTYAGIIYIINGKGVWQGGNSPSDGFVKDSSGSTPVLAIQQSDIKTYNNLLWVTTGSAIWRFGGSSWTSTYSYGTSVPSLLETHKGFLYFSFDNYKMGRIDVTNTPTTSGAGSLDLNKPGFLISFIKSDGNNLWVGLCNNSGSGAEKTYIYKWDGSTIGQAQSEYIIEARTVLSCAIVNGVPHVIDSKGRYLVFNGSFFQEVDRFPLKQNETLYNSYALDHRRAIHPNGMTFDSVNDEVLINVSNIKSLSGDTYTYFDFPGGVWSYKKETGLTHKYSPSTQPIANSGVTNLTGHGQYNILLPGAIHTLSLTTFAGEKGRVLFGCQYLPEGINPDIYVGLFTDDTVKTSQNNGYFITKEIHATEITDTWKQITPLYKNLLTSTDIITLKYNTEDDIPTETSVYWADIDRVTTTKDISSYSVGDEIKIVMGYGSGKSFKINSITLDTGTYTVILDDSISSLAIGKYAIAKFSKWIYLGKVTNNDKQGYKTFTTSIKNISPKLKVKVEIQSTGDNELDSIFINSDNIIKQ